MISLIQQTKIEKKLLGRIRRYCSKVLQFLKISDKKVTVIFVDKDYITYLNSTYFSKDKPTNVISFPFDEEQYLGEIYISVEIAGKEANEWEVSFFFEIMYLIIHGILHLLGYDHTLSEEDEQIMTEKEIEIVEAIGLKKWKKL
jgi:probable rRNA maturation factor